MDVVTATQAITALFPDQGARLLAEAGLSGTMGDHVAQMPADWLYAEGDTDEAVGETLLVNLREHFQAYGNLRAAFALTRELMKRRAGRLGADHPDTLSEMSVLGALLDRAGKLDEAGKLLDRAFDGLRSVAGGRDPRLAVAAQNLAHHYLRLEQPIRAEQLLEQAFRILAESAPEQTGPVAAQLGELLVRRQQTAQAVPYLQEAWTRYRDAYGVTDERTVARGRTLAAIYTSLDREADAIPVLRGLYQAAVASQDAEGRASIGFQLGNALENAGFTEESHRLVDESVRWTRAQTVDDQPHPELAARITTWSRMMLRRGRPTEAEGLLLEALEIDRWRHGEGSPEVAVRYANLGHLCAQTGRPSEARGWLEPAAKLLRSTLGDEAWPTRFAVESLCDLWISAAQDLVKKRDHVGARNVLLPAKELALQVLGRDHRVLAEIAKLKLT